jgi:hypothetical protein
MLIDLIFQEIFRGTIVNSLHHFFVIFELFFSVGKFFFPFSVYFHCSMFLFL